MQTPCRPEQAPQSRINLVQQAEDWSDEHSSESIHVIDLSVALNVPLRTLQRIFHETVGMGPAHYMAARKLAKARAALLTADPSATSALKRCIGVDERRSPNGRWLVHSHSSVAAATVIDRVAAVPCNNNYLFK